jgi:hypothetical protein
MMKRVVVFVFALAMVLALPSWADTINSVTFTGNAGGGAGSVVLGSTLTFTGGPLDLVKDNIICPTGCAITGGVVDLTSGTLLGPAVVNGNTKRYDFNAGGSLVLLGSILGNPSSTLLSANFDAGSFLLVNTKTGNATYSAVLTNIVIDPIFGIAVDGTNTENLKINLRTNQGKVTATGTSVDTVQTPEPASLSLLGAGMLGLAGFLRRRLAR